MTSKESTCALKWYFLKSPRLAVLLITSFKGDDVFHQDILATDFIKKNMMHAFLKNSAVVTTREGFSCCFDHMTLNTLAEELAGSTSPFPFEDFSTRYFVLSDKIQVVVFFCDSLGAEDSFSLYS